MRAASVKQNSNSVVSYTPSTPNNNNNNIHSNNINNSNNNNSTDNREDEYNDDAPKESWHALDLSNMGLRHLSSSIMHFTHLTALYLSHNALTDLPSVIFTHLPSLVFLDLSYNHFTHLPAQVGELQYLEELLLYNNKIVNLPWTLGRLAKLKNLLLGENPLVWPPAQVVQKGTTFIINYLRDRMPPPPPPAERKMMSSSDPNVFNRPVQRKGNTQNSHNGPSLSLPPIPTSDDNKLSVFCYNILAEKYATPERHSYTPCWALEWPYRKDRILHEMLTFNADILCLQEVEAKHYREFFQVEMTRAGYSGLFRPKSRARTMEDWDQVDGCVIFYRNKQFEFVEEHLIEFQAMAMSKHKEFEGDHEALMRIMTKDNIALVAVLQWKGAPLVVVNTHIHWDPQFSDVKLVQVQFMLERLAAIAGPGAPWDGAPLIICGDFNSLPGSGPYELITSGTAAATHTDLLEGFNYGSYSKKGFAHPFHLESAYGFMGEPPFTNYTLDFVGVLDYIFYTNKSLRTVQVLQPVETQTVKSTRLPNPFFSSDHISLLAELQIL